MVTNKAKVLLIALLPLLTSFVPHSSASISDLKDYGESIRSMIVTKNKPEFEKQFQREDLTPKDYQYDYYFGNDTSSELHSFMSSEDIQIRVFKGQHDYAVILYYRASLTGAPESLDWDNIGEHWLQIYAPLDVIYDGERWLFVDTPFYFFRGAPWINYDEEEPASIE